MPAQPANADATAALTAAAGAGPYFAVGPWAPNQGWRPATLLVSDREMLAGRVAHARADLADRAGIAPAEVAGRAAASIVFLGLAARLVSPALAAAALGGVVPYLTLDRLWLRDCAGALPLAAGPVPGRRLDLAQPGDPPGGAASDRLDDAAALLSEHCVQGMAGPVADVFGEMFRLSPQVLRGNIASALAGAAGMLAASFPARAETAAQLTARMLALEPLRGTGEFVRPDAAKARRFLIRRSCCLYYRIPGAGTCGDCVLTPEHVRRRQWQETLSS